MIDCTAANVATTFISFAPPPGFHTNDGIEALMNSQPEGTDPSLKMVVASLNMKAAVDVVAAMPPPETCVNSSRKSET